MRDVVDLRATPTAAVPERRATSHVVYVNLPIVTRYRAAVNHETMDSDPDAKRKISVCCVP